jgi:hypothetical protein
MKRIALLFLLPVICLGNDVETWNTIQASKSLGKGVSAGVSEESRIGVNQNENPKKFDEFHTTAFVDWKCLGWMSIGVQDDFVLLRDGTDSRYKRDNRPAVNLAFYHSYRGFDLMNRSRFIMRDLENERPYFRYRNLSKITMPEVVKLNDFPIRPYVSYEWYFDEGSKDRYIRKNDKFGQFWTDFGLQTALNANLNIAVFYRLVELKSTSDHDWSPGHVFGISANVVF